MRQPFQISCIKGNNDICSKSADLSKQARTHTQVSICKAQGGTQVGRGVADKEVAEAPQVLTPAHPAASHCISTRHYPAFRGDWPKGGERGEKEGGGCSDLVADRAWTEAGSRASRPDGAACFPPQRSLNANWRCDGLTEPLLGKWTGQKIPEWGAG